MRFKKRPVVIDAFRWLEDEAPDWWERFQNIEMEVNTGVALIPTLEGTMRASPGDWVIRGIAGEVYPCKPEIFEATYERVENEEA